MINNRFFLAFLAYLVSVAFPVYIFAAEASATLNATVSSQSKSAPSETEDNRTIGQPVGIVHNQPIYAPGFDATSGIIGNISYVTFPRVTSEQEIQEYLTISQEVLFQGVDPKTPVIISSEDSQQDGRGSEPYFRYAEITDTEGLNALASSKPRIRDVVDISRGNIAFTVFRVAGIAGLSTFAGVKFSDAPVGKLLAEVSLPAFLSAYLMITNIGYQDWFVHKVVNPVRGSLPVKYLEKLPLPFIKDPNEDMTATEFSGWGLKTVKMVGFLSTYLYLSHLSSQFYDAVAAGSFADFNLGNLQVATNVVSKSFLAFPVEAIAVAYLGRSRKSEEIALKESVRNGTVDRNTLAERQKNIKFKSSFKAALLSIVISFGEIYMFNGETHNSLGLNLGHGVLGFVTVTLGGYYFYQFESPSEFKADIKRHFMSAVTKAKTAWGACKSRFFGS